MQDLGTTPTALEAHETEPCCNEACQREVRLALELIEKLTNEKRGNDELRRNYAGLKSELETLRKKKEAVSREKITLEENQVALIAEYTAQTEERNQQIVELKKHVVQPKDLELMRLKVVEELQAEQAKKWAALEQHIEKYRGLYYKSQRECDELSAELERQVKAYEISMRELRTLHEEELRRNDEQTRQLKSCIEEIQKSDQTRQLRRDNNELEVKCRHLVSELEEVRHSKETAIAQKDQQIHLHARQVAEEQALSKSLQSEKEAILTRARRTEAELQCSLSATEEAKEECGKLREEISRLTSRVEELTHQFNVDCSDMKTALIQERNKYEQDLGHCQKELNTVQRLLQESNDSNRELTDKSSQMETRMSHAIKVIQSESDSKIASVEAEKEELQRAVSLLRQKLQKELTRYAQEVKGKEANAASLRDKMHSLNEETAHLRSATLQLTAQVGDLQTQLNAATARNCEIQERAEKAERAIAMADRDRESVREQSMALEANVRHIQQELADAHDALYRERRAHREQLEAIREAIEEEKRKRHLLEVDRSQLTDLYEQAKEDAKKERTTVQEQLKKLSVDCEKLAIENASLKAQVESYVAKRRQMREETRRRNAEFLSLLRTEGIPVGEANDPNRRNPSLPNVSDVLISL